MGADLYKLQKVSAITQIRNTDFDTWALAIGHASAGWSNTAVGANIAEVLRNSADWETIPRALAPTMSVDLTRVLASVQAPTLVMYRGEALWGDAGLSRALAAGIEGSQLRSFPGDASVLMGHESDALEAITSFVPTGTASPSALRPELVQASSAAQLRLVPTSSAAQPGLVQTIVFTDVEGSTDLTDRFGDAWARDLLRQHEGVTRDALAVHGGTEIKTMGDGFMASFASASGAPDAAIAMQRAMTDHFGASETPIRIRVGINAGEPIAEDDDLYGTAVIRAARIMGQADGGEILVSDLGRGLVAGKDYLFDDRGPAPLKGFEEPVRLFGVRWQANS